MDHADFFKWLLKHSFIQSLKDTEHADDVGVTQALLDFELLDAFIKITQSLIY